MMIRVVLMCSENGVAAFGVRYNQYKGCGGVTTKIAYAPTSGMTFSLVPM